MDNTVTKTSGRRNWLWIPSLYFAQGIPYVVVMSMSVILYKRLGISNTDIALYTSWLYLPWVIKPLWSPIVELLGTRRHWIVLMQLLIGAALGCVALSIPAPAFFKISLASFWLLAFSSATHDIAADGFYMLALSKHDQAWFVGVRSTFYRLAMITGQGLLIMLAGTLETRTGLPALQLQVVARPDAPANSPPDPALFQPAAAAPDPLRLVATPSTLTLNTAPATASQVNDLRDGARQWNQTQGFHPPSQAAPPTVSDENQQPSWWNRTVARPLENWLRCHFAPEAATPERPDQVGRAGAFLVSLSRQPEREVVVNLARQSGDQGIKLLEGDRFVFNRTNWSKAMMVVLQLDPKRTAPSQALFVARAGNIPLAWSITFFTLAGLFLIFFVYHRMILPRPAADTDAPRQSRNLLAGFVTTFGAFFRKPLVIRSLAFLLFYRFAESQLVKIASLFLLDGRAAGGLGLSTSTVGFVYGTVGVIALTLGGLLGGFVAARHGLKFWLPFMVVAINLPNLVYVYLALAAPESLLAVNACVAIEQLGYGFGFAAYMIYMLYVAQGEHQTAHYALCTGFMAVGMMLPGMFSGWLQEIIGYQNFFLWIMIATLPSFLVAAWIKVDPGFGKKHQPGLLTSR